MSKEKWIEEILQTGKAIQPLSSNPYMATRIEAKLLQPLPVNKLSLQWVYASAAILLLLVIMNISTWSRDSPKTKPSGVQQLIQEYGWNNNDLYSINLSNRQHE